MAIVQLEEGTSEAIRAQVMQYHENIEAHVKVDGDSIVVTTLENMKDPLNRSGYDAIYKTFVIPKNEVKELIGSLF